MRGLKNKFGEREKEQNERESKNRERERKNRTREIERERRKEEKSIVKLVTVCLNGSRFNRVEIGKQ